jgi:hypothetical protein
VIRLVVELPDVDSWDEGAAGELLAAAAAAVAGLARMRGATGCDLSGVCPLTVPNPATGEVAEGWWRVDPY